MTRVLIFPIFVGSLEFKPHYVDIRSGSRTERFAFASIVAFAGDYLGSITEPISTGITIDEYEANRSQLQQRFKNAFRSIQTFEKNKLYEKGNMDYLRKILSDEYEAILLSFAQMTKDDSVLLHHASSHSAVGKIVEQRTYLGAYGYSSLLRINLEHFDMDAIISFVTGHDLALQSALAAGKLWKAEKKKDAILKLNEAYAYEGFASHFLSDLFSAGHLRTPRRKLLEMPKMNFSISWGAMVGLMANAMHDEDGTLGLWGKNKWGDTWQAFGDGGYFDRLNVDN